MTAEKIQISGYAVRYYASDGSSVQSGVEDQNDADFTSVEEAKSYANKGFGSWNGNDGDVICYHESDEEGCGGYAVEKRFGPEGKSWDQLSDWEQDMTR